LRRAILLFAALMAIFASSGLQAQQAGYVQTNLVSNTSGAASTTDPQLANPWGISFVPGEDFWISDNKSGVSTLYDSNGNKDAALVVTIPGATQNPNGNCNPGCPTGTVANTGGGFGGGQFIFATQDGLITIWTGASNTATVAFDNSASGAAYTGLAFLNGTSLLAANFNSGKIDVFNSNFQITALSGSFTDPNLPAGYAPFGIEVINNQVYIAYAMQNTAKNNAKAGVGMGQVDVFDMNGNFLSTLVAAGGKLNAPWGVVAAPSTFGQFANDILVGNFGDGTINAFSTSGTFVGQLTNASNAPLVNPGLWDIVFGGGGVSGDPGTLFLTAGGSTPVFASVLPAAALTSGNFTLSLSAQSVNVTPGGSVNVTVSAAAVGGFNSPISLSCSTNAGISCAFSPSTIAPGMNTGSTLTLSAAPAPPPITGYHAAFLLPGLALFAPVLAGRKKFGRRRSLLAMKVLGLVFFVATLSLFAAGCGGGTSTSATPPTSTSPVIVTVTGTSGSITQPSSLTLNVQ
jgi:uncharacterized protein (TIGR03118 family)